MTPTAKPSTAKMPVWTPPASTTSSATRDTRPPSAVSNLRLLSNGETAIAIAWDMSQDNVAVKLYVVRGNGFTTIQTADTRATVPWAHRTANVSIQVSAIDTTGNQGEWRSLVVVPPMTAATTSAPTTAPATSSTPVVTTPVPSEPATSQSVPTDASSGATTVSSSSAQDPASTDQASVQPV